MVKYIYMLNFIDNFLNKTTMYRVVLYVLSSFFVSALILSILGFLKHGPINLLLSLFAILLVSYFSNLLFSHLYKAQTNVESVYITAFILFFLIPPLQGGASLQFFTLAVSASILAVASKYIFVFRKVHIMNPVALALVIIAFTIGYSPSWWIGVPAMLPFVFVGGVLIARKIRHSELLLSFAISTLVTIVVLSIFRSFSIGNIFDTIILVLKNSPFFFFGFVMLTEPLTAPTTKWPRVAFGVLVGILSTPSFHIGSFYFTPELALVIGNIFGFLISPKEKLILKLKERREIARDTFELVFDRLTNEKKFDFKPGQYMEWTFGHKNPDTRGVRRYFTLASSPTEEEIRLGIKFYPKPSTYKEHLLELPLGREVVASQKAGDFVLGDDKNESMVFIAGGIGITPFRSMIKYLIDKKEKRNITLLYSNKKVIDIAYREILDQAEKELGIKTIYAITDKDEILDSPNMYAGFIDEEVIRKQIPDYIQKTFYISGPHAMVNAFYDTLRSMGVPRKNIKIDFFPGFV